MVFKRKTALDKTVLQAHLFFYIEYEIFLRATKECDALLSYIEFNEMFTFMSK